MRPKSLREVAIDANSGRKTFAISIDEFLDTFYLAHPDKVKQQRMIDEAPDFTGNGLQDAWMGAVGEHVARRWGLVIPSWTRRPEHFKLERPAFIPDSAALRVYTLIHSPEAFRSRIIFTFPEPLQRARFPRDHAARR